LSEVIHKITYLPRKFYGLILQDSERSPHNSSNFFRLVHFFDDLFGWLWLPLFSSIVLEESVLEKIERDSFEKVTLPNFLQRIGHIWRTVVLFHEFVNVRFDLIVSLFYVEEILGDCELVCDKREADKGSDVRSPICLFLERFYQMAKHLT
jgi:hypothetical protein